MIEVKFRVFKNGSFKFSCRGHAGAGTAGNDIVCAGASALAYGLAENIRTSGDLFEEKDITINENEGIMRVSFKPKKEYIPAVSLLFKAKYNEFKLLEKTYQEYVHVVG